MARRIVGLLIGAIALGAMLAVPGSAAGDGAPAPFTAYRVSGPDGVAYAAVPARHGNTTVRKFGGTASRTSRRLDGAFAIPAVTLYGTPGGLSADGRTLVLVDQRQRITHGPTHVIVLDTRDLSVTRRLTFHGGFTFDALSPDGSAMFLIEYLSQHDRTKYAVREYDLQHGRLLRDPIVDPDEHAGEMRGYPLDRVMSTNGRWAYTLYDGGDGEPFVHALDTVKGRAVCVDLDGLVTASQVRDIRMAMRPSGDQLTMGTRKGRLAIIDTNSLEAIAPPSAAVDGGGGDGGPPWLVIAIVAALAVGGSGAFIASRNRRTSGVAARDA